MSPEAPELIATSLARTFLPHLRRTHDRRRISVFAGPPGIGKSTVLRAFATEQPWCVALASVPPAAKGGLKPAAVLQIVIEALSALTSDCGRRDRVPTGYIELRNRLFATVCDWVGIPASEVRRDDLDPDQFPQVTLILDEAQNLSREAIEMLRFANDATGGFSPLPLGLIFVGNNEFVLKAGRGGQSILSAAIADRALYTETYSYRDVTDDDLTLFFEAQGIIEPQALQKLVDYFRNGRADRSFRRAADVAAKIFEAAAGGSVTSDLIKTVLEL